MTERPKCAYPCGEGFPCGCKIEQYADKLEEQLAAANARIASLEDTVNKAGELLRRDEAALQKCANAYGKWEGSNMDPNEAIGWVGNHTRAAGFKPKKEGER
jgi:hypothetical protein